jgi:hypothetical protein
MEMTVAQSRTSITGTTMEPVIHMLMIGIGLNPLHVSQVAQ